jgi:hypothetical protein
LLLLLLLLLQLLLVLLYQFQHSRHFFCLFQSLITEK